MMMMVMVKPMETGMDTMSMRCYMIVTMIVMLRVVDNLNMVMVMTMMTRM